MSLTIASVAGKQRISRLLAWRTKSQASKLPRRKENRRFLPSSRRKKRKEAVADDTANSNTSITFRVNQKGLSDFSKNLEEPSPTENKEEIDDQTRSKDSHEMQCEKEYWSDLHANTRFLFFPYKIAIEQTILTLSLSQSWNKETKSSGFEESVGDSINDQNSAKMLEMWIANINPGRHSTVSILADARQ